MPKIPVYSLRYRSGVNRYGGQIFGAEYELPIQGIQDHNVPCAVCHVPTRRAILMIPATTNCPSTWTREYFGYLMSDYYGHKRTMFECVDSTMESLPGSSTNANGALFYHVEAVCNGLPCPPYNTFKELNCVVCTK